MCEVSVIVPVYNVEKFIEKCIRSITNQTFKDLEIIVVNDGSKDNSIKIINEKFNDDRIKIVNKENAGLPQARKTGVENASGKYIAFVDADDWIEATMIETMYKSMIGTNVDILCCGLQFDDFKGNLLKTQKIDEYKICDSRTGVECIHSGSAFFTYMWNKMFRRDVICIEDFPTGHFVGEDYCTMMNILMREYKIAQISDVLYHYVQHESNMIKAGFGKSQMIAYEKYMLLRPILLDMYPEYRKLIISYYFLEEMAIINSMIRGNSYDKKIKKEIFKDMRRHFFSYISQKSNSIIFKGSAVVMLVCFSLYKKIYIKFQHKVL